MSDQKEEEEKGWSELPSELLYLIAKKLPDLVDFIRFCAVCSTWRSSVALSDRPHQFPWLLELLERDRFSILRRRQRFYSVSSGETLIIPFKNKKLKLHSFIHGEIYSGYLPFADDSGKVLSFFNPLTKDFFSLPSMQYGLGVHWMVWTGSDPIRKRCIVVVDRDPERMGDLGGCAFYDPSSSKWVETWGYFCNRERCYWQGMLFCACINSNIEVFDVHSGKLLHRIPPPKIEWLQSRFNRNSIAQQLRKSYLVVSSGVILRVLWFHDFWGKKPVEQSVFHIYRLNYERAEDKFCWDRIDDIGDEILFFGEMNGFSMTAKPSIGFKKGCIYFIDPKENKPYMHDILAGTVERLPCPFEKCAWFLPS
ncbi:hypothetical protein LUZ61_016064 [Rhynchospora tenuis]|uniref:KIB1-4 beta-propeller domain-containing protein n=1 Tax=Rhynchospora tenuis TaxID=198213 RepID=A0AAD5Z4U7_9POAL|nr:hypothetical protein LUZ61_016064 [Rhynchospora tenuis]